MKADHAIYWIAIERVALVTEDPKLTNAIFKLKSAYGDGLFTTKRNEVES